MIGERIRMVAILAVALRKSVGTEIAGGRAPVTQRIPTNVEIPVYGPIRGIHIAYLLDNLETRLTRGMETTHAANARTGLGAVTVLTRMKTRTYGKLTKDAGTYTKAPAKSRTIRGGKSGIWKNREVAARAPKTAVTPISTV